MKSNKKTEIEKYCAFCEHSTETYDKEHFLCTKKGIVKGNYKCRKFRYDLQKRIPKRISTANITLDQ